MDVESFVILVGGGGGGGKYAKTWSLPKAILSGRWVITTHHHHHLTAPSPSFTTTTINIAVSCQWAIANKMVNPGQKKKIMTNTLFYNSKSWKKT